MTEDRTPYLASMKRDRWQAASILVFMKAILRIIVAVGLFLWLTSAPSTGWLLARAAAGAVIGAAAFWAVERIGK